MININSPINEPFHCGRESSRLIFDFGILISCLTNSNEDKENLILDFGAGSCWVSEWLNRFGYSVVSFDIINLTIGKQRLVCDNRLRDNFYFVVGSGDYLPFKENIFSNICFFDTLHHMKDYESILGKIFRVLKHGGRAIFIEPGSKHSKSKETQEFLLKFKANDPNWIERDVVVSEINEISNKIGFSGMFVKPFLLPGLVNYTYDEWLNFKNNINHSADGYISFLKNFNEESRTIFYLVK